MRRRIWLTKWDKVKAHDTIIDWCTGRGWPLNCMTVISVWWRSNMPFQRLSGRLNYYITRWDRKSVSWRSDELETRCGRESHTRPKGPSGPLASWGSEKSETRCGKESHHPAEGALGAPSSFGDPLVTRCGRESQHSAEAEPSGLRLSIRRTRKSQRWWP